MANTIWKEVFLIMCSSSKENARNTERFSLTLRITDNYTLQTLCGAPHNICNEEGKLLGMEGNRRIPGDVLAGPFFVVGDTGETFRSLTEEELVRYKKRFAEIEDISPQEVQAATGFFFCAM